MTMGARLPIPGGRVTQNQNGRFAPWAEEAAERELLQALHYSIHSTCLADHSAAQALADTFRVDLATVYRWARPRNGGDGIACRPVVDFFDFLDTVIRAKGEANVNAYALARLVRRRYLDPQANQRDGSPAVVVAGAADTMKAVGGLLSSLLNAVSPEGEGGSGVTRAELAALEPEFERVARLFESLRLAIPACVRKGSAPDDVEGWPS